MSRREIFSVVQLLKESSLESSKVIDVLDQWLAGSEQDLLEFAIDRSLISPGQAAIIQRQLQVELEDTADHRVGLQPDTARIAPTIAGHDVPETVGYADVRIEPLQNAVASSKSDRFRILRKHESGGLGVVYVAEDLQIGREVALKRMSQELMRSRGHRDKFEREAEITGRLEHPGIVPIYALGFDEHGGPYYAMKFIRGNSFAHAIQEFHSGSESGPTKYASTEFRQLLRRFVDICHAVEFAHENKILHRDLKPSNVMLGNHGETIVIDWGLAKSMHENAGHEQAQHDGKASGGGSSDLIGRRGRTDEETVQGTVLGTPAYAPPEQLRGELELISYGSDVYSLGAILYELLTGKRPMHDARSVSEILRRIDEGQHLEPQKVDVSIPSALAFVCAQAVQPEVQRRYASVSALREGIEQWLDDLPVVGHRESVVERFGRWLRHHQTLASSVLIGLLSAACILSGLLIASRQFAAQQKNLFQAERKLRDQERAVAVEAHLHDAQMARSRGQFREAADKLRLVSEQRQLTSSEQVLLAKDLFDGQMIVQADRELRQLDRQLLEPRQVAVVNLVEGDLRIMTKWESQGFEQIKQAIDSGLLAPADEEYARGLIADTYSACKTHFVQCLALDPLHLNALTKLTISCALTGELDDARTYLRFGKALWPEDVRLMFVDALVASMADDDEVALQARQRIEKIGGFADELRMIDFIAAMSRELRETLDRLDSTSRPVMEVFRFIGQYVLIPHAKTSQQEYGTLPLLGWMGAAYKSFPGPVALLQLAAFNQVGPVLDKLRPFFPHHQMLNTIIAYHSMQEGRYRDSERLLVESFRMSSMSNSVKKQAPWVALVSAVAPHIQDQVPIDETSLIAILSQIESIRGKGGKFEKDHFDLSTKYAVLLRVRMYLLAAELAGQQVEVTTDAEQALWSERKRLAERLASEHDSHVKAALEELKSKFPQ